MRDVLIILFALGCMPIPLFDAFAGLLVYCIWSFLKPQTLSWSPVVQQWRFTFFIAVFLLARAWVATAGPKIRLRGPSVWFVIFWLWMGVCSWLSPYREDAMEFFIKFSKIAVAMILITGLVRTRGQLKALLIVMGWCAGFYAIKLGLFLMTSSERTSHGGPLGLDNNDTALFIAVGLPLLFFMSSQIRSSFGRRLTLFAAIMSVPAIVVGGSRGGLLAMAAAWGLIIWRRFGIAKGVAVGLLGFMLALPLVPQATYDRYLTIGEGYQQDASAQGRVWAWGVATRMANAHPWTGIGVGQRPFVKEYTKFKVYEEDVPHVAHSVWFTTLAGMGYVGLALYAGMMVSALRRTRRTMRLARKFPGRSGEWVRRYSEMVFISLVAFCIGATFLSQIGFEFIYGILLLTVPLWEVAQRELETVETTETQPAEEFVEGLPEATRERLRRIRDYRNRSNRGGGPRRSRVPAGRLAR